MQFDLDLQEHTDPENDPLIPHTRPSDVRWPIARTTCRVRALRVGPAGNSGVACLGGTWHGYDWSPFDGWEKRASADDLSASDPAR